MRISTIVMISLAALFGLIAVFVAQSWLSNQSEKRLRSLEANVQGAPIGATTIVVASKPLRFGAELGSSVMREVGWPGDAVPTGAFGKISEIIQGNARRVVLAPIEVNEPILVTKVTGPGQRATLSATLQDGMRAVTVRVNDVDGVAGFVLPGDRVDVALTRQPDRNNPTTDVVLQNIRVLAIDQTSDERNDKPSIAKAVTLEVDAASAQKLALSAAVGALSLMLRKAGDTLTEATRRITLNDLIRNEVAPSKQGESAVTNIKVHRPAGKVDYSVRAESYDDGTTVGRRATEN